MTTWSAYSSWRLEAATKAGGVIADKSLFMRGGVSISNRRSSCLILIETITLAIKSPCKLAIDHHFVLSPLSDSCFFILHENVQEVLPAFGAHVGFDFFVYVGKAAVFVNLVGWLSRLERVWSYWPSLPTSSRALSLNASMSALTRRTLPRLNERVIILIYTAHCFHH